MAIYNGVVMLLFFNVLKRRYKGKSYSATVEICDTSDQITDFCRDVCRRLECCPNLISPHSYNTICPENCLRLAKGKYREFMKFCFLSPLARDMKWLSWFYCVVFKQHIIVLIYFQFSPLLQFCTRFHPHASFETNKPHFQHARTVSCDATRSTRMGPITM